MDDLGVRVVWMGQEKSRSAAAAPAGTKVTNSGL